MTIIGKNIIIWHFRDGANVTYELKIMVNITKATTKVTESCIGKQKPQLRTAKTKATVQSLEVTKLQPSKNHV